MSFLSCIVAIFAVIAVVGAVFVAGAVVTFVVVGTAAPQVI